MNLPTNLPEYVSNLLRQAAERTNERDSQCVGVYRSNGRRLVVASEFTGQSLSDEHLNAIRERGL